MYNDVYHNVTVTNNVKNTSFVSDFMHLHGKKRRARCSTGLNNVLLPTLFTLVNNIEQFFFFFFFFFSDRVAQLEEHWASIPKVVGSNPTVAGHIFQARPVWICTQSNIANIILNNVVEPESGVTVLFNIVDSYEQCGQQNIVQSCFHQYCINPSVFTRVEEAGTPELGRGGGGGAGGAAAPVALYQEGQGGGGKGALSI